MEEGVTRYKPIEGKFKGTAQCSKCGDVHLVRFTFPRDSMVFGYKVREPFSFLTGTVGAGVVERITDAYMGISDIERFVKSGINLRPFVRDLFVYPEDISPSCPEYVPERVRKHFIEAQKLLMDAGSERYALVALRLTVESALRELLGTEKGSLRELIKKASEKNLIPPILAEVADVIRSFGNVGAHPDELEGFIDEIPQVMEFTRLFLELAFTYPEKIKRLKASLK